MFSPFLWNKDCLSAGLELDSGSNASGSLPSPGAGSCSLDGPSSSTSPNCGLMDHAPSPVGVSSTTSTSSTVGELPLSQRVGVLQQRVSRSTWFWTKA